MLYLILLFKTNCNFDSEDSEVEVISDSTRDSEVQSRPVGHSILVKMYIHNINVIIRIHQLLFHPHLRF